MSVLRLRLALFVLVALPTATAHASNTKHERTPVIWDGGGGSCRLPALATSCMTLHDRGDGALHIPYGIPYEDTDVGPDEAPQSRTHQFVAFCRPHPIEEAIPSWMTEADVAASEAVGQSRPGAVPASDILELREDWDDCWYRINADADRRPITCEMAEAGVDWDTTDVPVGAYTIDAYTYEPQYNFWVLRPGVVKLHDGDPDAVGPAAAVSTAELSVHRNQIAMIEGCVDAIDGSTFTAYWSHYGDGMPDWIEYVADQPIAGPSFEIEFAPPEPLWGEIGMLRVDVADPTGRSYTAYMAGKIVVVNADGPGGCGGEGSFVGGSSCDESGDGSSGADESGGNVSTTGEIGGSSSGTTTGALGSESSSTAGETPTTGGCGCDAPGGGLGSLVLFAMLALLGYRRP